jgi:hypothetical protein
MAGGGIFDREIDKQSIAESRSLTGRFYNVFGKKLIYGQPYGETPRSNLEFDKIP